MLESKIENYLFKQIRKADPEGLCFKWVSPGNKGVPDRVVFINKQVWFIELKSPYGELSVVQGYIGRKIQKQTPNYRVISSKKEVDAFINEVMK
jgi:hypothetical protein